MGMMDATQSYGRLHSYAIRWLSAAAFLPPPPGLPAAAFVPPSLLAPDRARWRGFFLERGPVEGLPFQAAQEGRP